MFSRRDRYWTVKIVVNVREREREGGGGGGREREREREYLKISIQAFIELSECPCDCRKVEIVFDELSYWFTFLPSTPWKPWNLQKAEVARSFCFHVNLRSFQTWLKITVCILLLIYIVFEQQQIIRWCSTFTDMTKCAVSACNRSVLYECCCWAVVCLCMFLLFYVLSRCGISSGSYYM